MQIKLSSGETVTLKTRFTRKAHKALFSALNKGVVWKQSLETGEYEKELPAENIEFQYEAVFPLLIEKIEKGGKQIPYSQDWLDDLLQEDFKKIEDKIIDVHKGPVVMENGEPVVDENGEKKA